MHDVRCGVQDGRLHLDDHLLGALACCSRRACQHGDRLAKLELQAGGVGDQHARAAEASARAVDHQLRARCARAEAMAEIARATVFRASRTTADRG
jgi:hypothetical protein